MRRPCGAVAAARAPPSIQARGSEAVGALAIGAFAVGAAAVGGYAIGRLSIKRLKVGEASFGKLEIEGSSRSTPSSIGKPTVREGFRARVRAMGRRARPGQELVFHFRCLMYGKVRTRCCCGPVWLRSAWRRSPASCCSLPAPAGVVGPYPDPRLLHRLPVPPTSTSPTARPRSDRGGLGREDLKVLRAANSSKVICYIDSHAGNVTPADFGSLREDWLPLTRSSASVRSGLLDPLPLRLGSLPRLPRPGPQRGRGRRPRRGAHATSSSSRALPASPLQP